MLANRRDTSNASFTHPTEHVPPVYSTHTILPSAFHKRENVKYVSAGKEKSLPKKRHKHKRGKEKAELRERAQGV